MRAETGAGKTTRVPPAMLGAGVVGDGRIVMLEPRRIAARSAARRMAAEWGVEVGEEIGYQVRFDRRHGPTTRILVVTEGVLLRMLQADPFLDGVELLIFDEFHERRLDSDLALAMARRVQREVRPGLKLLVMSATLDAAPVAEFLGGCPVLESAGRSFPVEISYIEPAPSGAAIHGPEAAERAAREVPAMHERAGGDLLVFFPGVGEIRRAESLLGGWSRDAGVLLMPLYGDLAAAQQDAALSAQPQPRVVLATNVAESSVTVDGVAAVIDTGLARTLRYDPGCGLDRLELGRISRASAEQRAGRAGRQGPGRCLRLWSRHEQRGLPRWETPEVQRVDLSGAVLQLAAWGETDPAAFPWFEAPAAATLQRAGELLRLLGAVDARGAATSLGRALATLPAQPRLARLVLAARRLGCARRGALAAALLAERSPFDRSELRGRAGSRSDLLDRVEKLEALRGRGSEERIRRGAAHVVLRSARQLESAARRVDEPSAEPQAAPADAYEALSRALLAAFPERLARLREGALDRGVMVGGRGVALAPESAVRGAELFLCLDLDAGRREERAEAWVRQAHAVEAEWLPERLLSEAVEVEYDRERDRVLGRRRVRYLDLVIDEAEHPVAAGRAAEALAGAALAEPEQALGLERDEVKCFLARVESLAVWRPELELPAFDQRTWREIVPLLAAGRRSFAELRRAPLLDALRGTLSREQQLALEREAPERIEVPSGSRIRLVYEPGKPPLLAARIQELFGLAETPRVAAGEVPVMLHLLAPNMRPQQVTQDLASFWKTTYPQVRKELAGRYPKHAWPEDPLAAAAERRPRRRR